MDLISRQDALDALRQCHKHYIALSYSDLIEIEEAEARIRRAPSAQPEIVKTILEAGYTGQEVRFRIDGRLFAVRELAQ